MNCSASFYSCPSKICPSTSYKSISETYLESEHTVFSPYIFVESMYWKITMSLFYWKIINSFSLLHGMQPHECLQRSRSRPPVQPHHFAHCLLDGAHIILLFVSNLSVCVLCLGFASFTALNHPFPLSMVFTHRLAWLFPCCHSSISSHLYLAEDITGHPEIDLFIDTISYEFVLFNYLFTFLLHRCKLHMYR